MLRSLVTKYNIQKNYDIAGAETLCKQALCTWVCGLMFYSFGNAATQVALRNDIERHMQILDNGGVGRQWLPKALRDRADLAMIFQVAI